MSVKFPMHGGDMQSLYTLAWFGKQASSAGAEDPVFSGYHAVEAAADAESEAPAEEAEVLSATLAVRTEGEPTAEEVNYMRNRKRWEAERILRLFNLGFTDL